MSFRGLRMLERARSGGGLDESSASPRAGAPSPRARAGARSSAEEAQPRLVSPPRSKRRCTGSSSEWGWGGSEGGEEEARPQHLRGRRGGGGEGHLPLSFTNSARSPMSVDSDGESRPASSTLEHLQVPTGAGLAGLVPPPRAVTPAPSPAPPASPQSSRTGPSLPGTPHKKRLPRSLPASVRSSIGASPSYRVNLFAVGALSTGQGGQAAVDEDARSWWSGSAGRPTQLRGFGLHPASPPPSSDRPTASLYGSASNSGSGMGSARTVGEGPLSFPSASSRALRMQALALVAPASAPVSPSPPGHVVTRRQAAQEALALTRHKPGAKAARRTEEGVSIGVRFTGGSGEGQEEGEEEGGEESAPRAGSKRPRPSSPAPLPPPPVPVGPLPQHAATILAHFAALDQALILLRRKGRTGVGEDGTLRGVPAGTRLTTLDTVAQVVAPFSHRDFTRLHLSQIAGLVPGALRLACLRLGPEGEYLGAASTSGAGRGTWQVVIDAQPAWPGGGAPRGLASLSPEGGLEGRRDAFEAALRALFTRAHAAHLAERDCMPGHATWPSFGTWAHEFVPARVVLPSAPLPSPPAEAEEARPLLGLNAGSGAASALPLHAGFVAALPPSPPSVHARASTLPAATLARIRAKAAEVAAGAGQAAAAAAAASSAFHVRVLHALFAAFTFPTRQSSMFLSEAGRRVAEAVGRDCGTSVGVGRVEGALRLIAGEVEGQDWVALTSIHDHPDVGAGGAVRQDVGAGGRGGSRQVEVLKAVKTGSAALTAAHRAALVAVVQAHFM
jgi:hypothetical protein